MGCGRAAAYRVRFTNLEVCAMSALGGHRGVGRSTIMSRRVAFSSDSIEQTDELDVV
jgi:hypothetical protein